MYVCVVLRAFVGACVRECVCERVRACVGAHVQAGDINVFNFQRNSLLVLCTTNWPQMHQTHQVCIFVSPPPRSDDQLPEAY